MKSKRLFLALFIITAILAQFLTNPSTASAAPPTVTTNAATSVTMSSAVLNGTLNTMGTVVSANVSFDWGTDANYGYNIPATPPIVNGSQTFTANFNGLQPNTTYYFRAKAMGTSVEDTGYGTAMTFTTLADPNTLFEHSNIYNVSTADRSHAGFYAAQTFTPQTSHTIREFKLSLYNETTDGTLTGSIRNVDANGAPTGPDLAVSAPIIESGMPLFTFITYTFDLGNGCQLLANTRYALVIHSTVGGLLPGQGLMILNDITNPYPRGQYVAGSDGSSWNTSYVSADVWFEEWGISAGTTAPAVTTSAAQSITSSSAVLNGALSSLGSASNVNVSFDWGTNPANYGANIPGIPPTINTNGTTFTANLSGLLPNTIYHFRARAVGNGATGTGLGTDMTFTTPPNTGANTLFEYNNTALSESHAGFYTAQTFTPTIDHTIRLFKLRIRPESANGTLTGSVRKVDITGAPTGPDLAVSAPIIESGLPPYTYTTVTFDLGNGCQLLANTRYALVIHSTVGDDASGHGLMVSNDINNPYPGGQYINGTNGSIWNLTNTAYDLWFEEWGTSSQTTLPSVTTNAATSITSSSAVLRGTLTSTGTSVSANVSFDWSQDSTYVNNIPGNPSIVIANQTFTANLNGLKPSTTYHFRAKAIGVSSANPGLKTGLITPQAAGDPGTGLGFDMTFTTASDPNTRYEYNGTGTDSSHAGYYTAQTFTPLTSHFIKEFKLKLSPETANGILTGSVRNVDTTGAPTGPDLAISAPIVESGMPRDFTGLPQNYNIVTFDLGNGCQLLANTRYALVIHSTVGDDASGHGLMVVIDPNHPYPRGQYVIGNDGLYWNMANTDCDLWFEEWGTIDNNTAPVVTTNAATSVTTVSALLNGTLTTLGTAASVNVSFDWGTDQNYGQTIQGIPPTINTNGTTFTANLSGLLPNTIYHFRARAAGNGATGTGLGTDMTFTTLSTGTTFTVTASVTGGHGTVSQASQTVNRGGSVTISVQPETGYWINSITDYTAPVTVTDRFATSYVISNVVANHALVFTFARADYTLTLNTSGSGTVSANSTGPYRYGYSVLVTANASEGSYFSAWSGDISGSVNPAIITIDRSKSVTANFIANTPPAVSYGGNSNAYTPQLPPPSPPLTFSGLKGNADLNLDALGRAQNAVQLTTEDGQVTFDIGRNTGLVDAANIPLTSISANVTTSPALPPPQYAVLMAYEFGPEGAVFVPSITLTMPLDISKLPAGTTRDSITIAYWNGTKWITVESKIEGNTITAQITHFSQWGIIAQVIPPAKFSISDLKLSADTIAPGDMVNIQTTVSNAGGASGKYTAVLKVNDEIISSQDVTLEAGSSKMISFGVAKGTPGSYTIDINGKAGKFTVAVPKVQPPVTTKPVAAITPAPVNTPSATAAAVTPSGTPQPAPQKQSNQTIIWLVIGAVVVICLAVGLVAFRFRTKRS